MTRLRALACAIVLASACQRAQVLAVSTSESVRDAAPPTEAPARDGFVAVLAPTASVDVTSTVSGTLRDVNVRPGSTVHEGDALAALTDRELVAGLRKASATSARSAAELQRARTEHEDTLRKAARTIDLAGLVPREEIESARHESRVAAAGRDGALSQLAADRAELQRLRERHDSLTIRAPFSGTITILHRVAGEHVQAGEPIARLVSLGGSIRFAVPHDLHPPLRVGARVVFVSGDGRAEIPGRVTTVSPTIDAASMVLVEAAPDGPLDDLRLGERGRVHVQRPAP